MKSKMKSTFAIIAVALMVMVAVVPMVSVFTDNSVAEPTVIPDEVGDITISGKVLNATGNPVTGKTVMVTWGNSYKQTGVSTNTGYSVVIKYTDIESKITSVKVFVLKDGTTSTVDEEYGIVELGDLTPGSYNADLVSGYKNTQSVSLALKGAPTSPVALFKAINNITSANVDLYSITATYTLYKTRATDGTYSDEIQSGTVAFSKESSKFVDKIVISVKSDVSVAYLEVTKITAKATKASEAQEISINANSADKNIITTTGVTATSKQYVATVTAGIDIPDATITVTQVKKDTFTSDKISMISSKANATAKAYFIYEQPVNEATSPAEQTANLASYTISFNNGAITRNVVDASLASNNVTITVGTGDAKGTLGLIYGKFQMGSSIGSGDAVEARDNQNLVINLATYSEEKFIPGAGLKVYVANGCYVAQVSDSTVTSSILQVKVSGFTLTSIQDKAINKDGYTPSANLVTIGTGANILVGNSGYTLVTGQFKDTTSPTAQSITSNLAIDFKSNASTIYAFGSVVSGNIISVKAPSGAFKEYVETGSSIEFLTPSTESYVLTNADGPYVILTTGGAYTFDPIVATKTVSFTFKNGDGTKVAAPNVNLSFDGGKTFTEYTLDASGSYTFMNGTVDLTTAKVFFTDATKVVYDAYDKDTAVAYSPDAKGKMNVVSNEKTYSILVLDNSENVINTALTTQEIKVYEAYVTETGNYVFTPTGNALVITSLSDGKKTFITSSKYMGKTIGAEAQKIIAFKLSDSKYIFEEIYVFEADESGNMTVKALADSYSNTLTRTDKETGIPGILVKMFNSEEDINDDTKMIGKTVTDEDGKFTINTSVAINKVDAVLVFVDEYGYDFNNCDDAYTSSGKVKASLFKPAKDSYIIVVADADKSLVDLTGLTLAVSNATKVGYYYSAAWKVGDIVSATLMKGENTYRTFAKYTITEDDFKSGIIGLTTLESTYTINVEDSEGNAIDALPKVYKTYGGINPTEVTPTTGNHIGKVEPSPTVIGKYTVVLTAPGVGEAYVAGPRADTAGNATEYKFGTGVYVPFEDNKATIESYYTIVAFELVDGDGNAVPVPTDNVVRGVVSDSYPADVRQIIVSESDNIIMFCGDDSAVYKVFGNYANNAWTGGDWTVGDKYTFKESAEIVEGELASAEQLVTFTFLDSLKQPISGIVPTVKYYDATHLTGETLLQNLTTNDAGQISGIVAIDDDYTYGATVANDAFEFAYTDGMAFIADKALVTPTFFTANGKDIEATVANFTKVEAFGINDNTPIATLTYANAKSFYVDMSLVSYYKVTTANGMKYTFDESLLPVFVANETFLTGTVPYSGKGTGSATLELYLEDNMVQEIKGDNVKIVDKYYYEAILDLSGYIGETAGVVFDSIIVVYYENGVELGYAAVDPYKTVNNIVTPEVEVYVAVLDAPSALISRHVSIAQVGNTATVSADGQFIVADDDAIYTDGQYIYTFAGWYVDNEKVSASPSFTFSLTENVVIVPEYTVKYEKISDANAQVDPEIIIEEITKENAGIDTNVLIIGIAAVIVALIAVVYAVIKKE